MLKGISPVVSPELLKALCEMGHGDELVIADGNFPCESIGKNAVVVRADGHGTAELLDAVLRLIPLDRYTEKPVAYMEVVKGDSAPTPEIWKAYEVEAIVFSADLLPQSAHTKRSGIKRSVFAFFLCSAAS